MGHACAEWQGLLAMRAVGRSVARDDRELRRHLANCATCRRDATELVGVAAALALADVGEIGSPAGPDLAPARPAGDHRPGVPAWHSPVGRLRGGLVGVGAAVGMVATVGAVLATLGGVSGPPARTGVLTGEKNVSASVVLTAQPWGTKVDLVESGEAVGQVFTVGMRTSSGYGWVAGSYRTTARPGSLEVEFSCAALANQITEVWITDQGGRTVLSGYLA